MLCINIISIFITNQIYMLMNLVSNLIFFFRIRTRVTDPYNKIVARNDQLRRLQVFKRIFRATECSRGLGEGSI